MFERWIGLPKRLMQGLKNISGQLYIIKHNTERIISIMTTTQADIDALTAQLGKATDEIKTQVANLEAQIAEGGNLNISGLKAAVGLLDDLNPDAPAPEAAETPAVEPEPTV